MLFDGIASSSALGGLLAITERASEHIFRGADIIVVPKTTNNKNSVAISVKNPVRKKDERGRYEYKGILPSILLPILERPFIAPMQRGQKVAGDFPATLSLKKVEKAIGTSAVSKTKIAGELPEKVLVRGQVEDRAAIAVYTRVSGEYIFSGWNGSGATSLYVRPDSARIERYEQNLPRVLNLGMPGGETSPKDYSLKDENARLERTFVAMLLAQIIRGPESLTDDTFRLNFNLMVERSFHPDVTSAIGPDNWNLYIQEAMRFSVMYARTFGDKGFETLDEIESTAAAILGIDAKTFAAWEDHFAFSAISTQFRRVLDTWFGRSRKDELNKTLTAALESELSSSLTDNRNHISAIDRAYAEWIILALSSIGESNAKSDEVKKFIEAQFLKGLGPVAGLALAMVVSHSELSRQSLETDYVKQWTKREVEDLFGKVMTSRAWAIVSHRFFRDLVDVSLQGSINRAVANANYNNAIAEVRALDVEVVSDREFWSAIEMTGQEETLMMEAITRMGKNGIGLN